MKVSLSRLKQLVDFDLSNQEVADKLSLSSIGVKELTQDFLELDLTYNRGDLLSLRGVARELAAVTGSKLLFSTPKSSDYLWTSLDLPKTPVEIEDEKLSTVQCVAKIEGLRMEKSNPEWIKKLADCGIRSVNNIADITNLIMLEYGQPLHSFDADTVLDDTIIVRRAKDEEEIVTLDGKIRKLNKDDIVLADDEKALDVAGVMGGKDTEVESSTTTILLSASLFNPSMIRNTANKLGLHSEASKRFQHGLTKTNLLQALSAAIKMYQEIGGKLTTITLTGNLTDEIKTIKLTQDKINSLIGIEIPPDHIESALKSLGFKLASYMESGNVVWDVTIPYWRLDINIEEDLIEEAARMYGYEKIPSKELKGELPQKLDQTFSNFIYDLKENLAKIGLTEVQTYSFYSTQIIENLKLKIENLIHVANPISSETEYMRDNLWPNLLEVVARNLRQGCRDIAIFEIGKIYLPKKGDLPNEPYTLSIALSNGSDDPIQELCQIAQNLFPKMHLRGEKMQLHHFHPTRFAPLEKDGRQIGFIAEIHPRFVNKFGVEQRVAVLEIMIPDRK